jgi:hypothetical protein
MTRLSRNGMSAVPHLLDVSISARDPILFLIVMTSRSAVKPLHAATCKNYL